MEQLPPSPQEKELPSPNEKLLVCPTLWEKQGKAAKVLAICSIIIIILIYASSLLIQSQKTTTAKLTQPNISTVPIITSASDPTANWKTYTNPKYGYNLRYPTKLFTKCESNGYLYLEDGPENASSCYAGESIPAFYIVNTLEGTGNFQKSEFKECYSVEQEPIEVDGVMGTKYSNSIENDKGVCDNQVVNYAKNQLHIVLNKNNVLYNIGFYEDQNKNVKYQILSTLKFLDQMVDTSNWKTYTNEKWRIEFKYPADLKIIGANDSGILIAKDHLGSNGIHITSDKDEMIAVNSLKTCSVVYKEIQKNQGYGDRPACLDEGMKFGQSQDIGVIKLGGIDVRSFYVTSTGRGGTTHVIQAINPPLIQVFSSDLNETIFNQILSTFKFIGQNETDKVAQPTIKSN